MPQQKHPRRGFQIASIRQIPTPTPSRQQTQKRNEMLHHTLCRNLTIRSPQPIRDSAAAAPPHPAEKHWNSKGCQFTTPVANQPHCCSDSTSEPSAIPKTLRETLPESAAATPWLSPADPSSASFACPHAPAYDSETQTDHGTNGSAAVTPPHLLHPESPHHS